MSDDEWIELRRYDDPLRAEMTRNFLVDHGVRVGMRGHPGANAVLNRFTTVVDIRLDVPRVELEAAREAMAALEEADVGEQPFRGRTPRTEEEEPAAVEAPKRSGVIAFVLALLVPIGGGHFYARHSAAGMIFLVGIIGAGAGAMFGGRPELLRTSALLVACDAVLSYWAVKRHNAGRVPKDGVQTKWALAVVVLAFALSLATA